MSAALSLPAPFVPVRTFGAMHLDGGSWIISEAEPHVSIRIKQLFPRIPQGSVPPYSLNRSETIDADLQWFTSRYPLRLSNADAEELASGQRAYLAHQAQMERILLPDYVPATTVGLREGKALRSYQAQAIDLANISLGVLIGDDCGLGKTVEGLGFCLSPEHLPAIVVCQVHLQKQWAEKFAEFTNLRVHAIKKTTPYDLPTVDVCLFRYTQLGGWADIFAKGYFKTVIYDEPQELRRGEESAKGVGAAAASDHTHWHLGLTATPIYNYGGEIWNVMRFIRADVLGDRISFQREYCTYGDRLKDPQALGSFLREQHAFLRRTKKDVGRELPAVSPIIHMVDYDAAKIHSIDDVARNLARVAISGQFSERGTAIRELDLLARQTTGIAKAKNVADVARVIVESGTPLILVGWHRAVYDIWLERLKDLHPLMYTGSETAAQKNRTKESFLAGDSNLLIGSLRSGSGLDGLQARCSMIAFGELDWSPGIHHQWIERIDRDGQTEPVTALYLVSDDGSDPPMMEVLGLKASEAHQVVDPGMGVQAVSSDTSHLQALVRRYLGHAAADRATRPDPSLQAFTAERPAARPFTLVGRPGELPLELPQ